MLNLKAFLRTGTTHVHVSKRGGVLPKLVAPLLATLLAGAVAAGVGFSTSNADHPTALDPFSNHLQSMVGNGPGSVKVVSTNSPQLSSFLKNLDSGAFDRAARMPQKAGSAGTADAIAEYYRTGHKPAEGKAYAFPDARGRGFCLVNTYENFELITKSVGQPSQAYIERTSGLGGTVYQPVHEAEMAVLLHELQHCTSIGDGDLETRAVANWGEAGKAYAMAIQEMFADLAVVLYMGAQEGTFANGLALTRATRGAAFVDIEHNTEDMLDHVVEHLAVEDYAGMTPEQVFAEVNHIAERLDPLSNAALRNAFAKSAAEKVLVGYRALSKQPGLKRFEYHFDNAANLATKIQKAIATHPTELDPDARARKILGDMITNNLRAADLHRSLGIQTVSNFQYMAKQLDVTLDVTQLRRAAVVDPEFARPGSGELSPFAADQQLSSTDLVPVINAEHQSQNQVKQKPVGPRN